MLTGRTYTAHTWEEIGEQQWAAAQERGIATSEVFQPGTISPQLTNAEAIALVSAWHKEGGDQWADWWQYVATAAGWNPATDAIERTDAQAQKLFPPDAAVLLQLDLQTLQLALDEHSEIGMRSLTVPDVWGTPALIPLALEAVTALKAGATFKIPLPACKHPKTGKPSWPKRDPKTGKWACEIVTVDDPITAVGSPLAKILLGALAAWGIYTIVTRR